MTLRKPPFAAKRAGVTHHAVPSRSAQPEPERVVRPIPERTGPRRTPDTFLRTEQAPGVGGAALTPIAHAVTQAYQVFEEYLEEGRQFAAGQSAWNAQPTAPSLTTQPTDLVTGLMWLFEQINGAAAMRPNSLPTPQAWPQPQWPVAPREPTIRSLQPTLGYRGSESTPEWRDWSFDAPEGRRAPPPIPAPRPLQPGAGSSRPGHITPSVTSRDASNTDVAANQHGASRPGSTGR